MADETLDKLGSTLAGFQVLGKIGEGAMGAVYKARQLSLDRIVAIKVLPPQLAQDAAFVRQFQEEARAAARLNHPHLIAVYEAGKTDGTHFFVMEYVEGENIGDRLRREGPFHEHTATGICMNVAQALHYAWEKAQLIHGDIKPENLILERDTKLIRIADLGLAKCLTGRLDDFDFADAGHSMGTPAYLSPEQCAGKKELDFHADMYALGATLYHMLTGKVPFDGLSHAEVMAQHLKGNLPDPRTVRAGISDATVVVLERMLAKEPGDRYPTWASLAHDLNQIRLARGLSVPPLPEGRSTLQRSAPHAIAAGKKKVSALRIAIELVVIFALLAGVYWYVRIRPQQQPGALPWDSTTPTPSETVQGPEPFPAADAGFRPSRIAGLQMWLSADRNVARDERNFVSAWGDQSGHDLDAQQTTHAAKPLFVADAVHGKPAIRFDGQDDQMGFEPLHAPEFTIFVVCTVTETRPGAGLVCNRVPEKDGFQVVDAGESSATFLPQLTTWNGSEDIEAKRAAVGRLVPFGPAIQTWTSDMEFFLNGLPETVEDGSIGSGLQGAYLGRGPKFLGVDIAEVLMFSSVLPPPDRQRIESYLAQKYGILQTAMAGIPPAPGAGAPVPPTPSPEKRREELRAKGEAQKQYVAWRTGFEGLLRSSEYGKAQSAAEAAQNEPLLAPVKASLARDRKLAQLILRMRDAARTNLLGQTYSVGATAGTVSRFEADKFWVRLPSGEIAVPLDKLDAAKLPEVALGASNLDPDLQTGAALYCWYRGETERARLYFDAARKAGADVTPFLPAELATMPPTPVEPAPRETPAERVAPPRAEGASLLANHSFERWSGKTLLDWASSNSQVRPAPDMTIVRDGKVAVRLDCNNEKVWLEQPVHLLAARKYELQLAYRTKGFEGQLWVEAGPPGDPVPMIKYPLEPNEEWMIASVELASSSTSTLALRIRANNATGTIWLDQFDLRFAK